MEFGKKTEQLKFLMDNREELSGRLEYQLYEANFATGLKLVFRRMLEVKDRSQKNEKNNGYSNWMAQKDDSNIVAFIGGRGAGKTTSMKEFCHILEGMNGKGSDERLLWLKNVLASDDDINALMKSSIRFHILKMVDAGLLNESEDLLELILISLYQEYTDKLEENRELSRGYQSVMMEIDQLFEDLLAMYSSTRKRNAYDEDYTLATLARMTGNGELMRQKISQLLDKMRLVQKQKADHEYYVFPIDDLDLNLEHGYEMIEQLQKYFSDERILILLTMDYEQLCDVCMEHFHRGMSFTDSFTSKDSMLRSQVLATDMMTKVFPLNQRIFLPDVRKQGKQMRVVMDDMVLPVKKYVMENVAYCMRIYYDAKGTKRHFAEPDTVRQLVFYNDFLASLYHIEYEKMKTWLQIDAMSEGEEKEAARKFNRARIVEYTHNHHRFNDDIAKRQAQTMLTIPQRQTFKTFLGFDLSRRAMYLVRAENEEGRIRFEDVPVEERSRYAYADLIEKLYTWGREHYEDKPFVSCVLASFTSEMVREYVNYRYSPDPEKRDVSGERLRKFMGRSFGNEWLGSCINIDKKKENEITEFWYTGCVRPFAGFLSEFDNGLESIGFREQTHIETVFLTFSLDALENVKNKPLPKGKPRETRMNHIRNWLEKEKVIPIIECLDMLMIQPGSPEGNASDYDGAKLSFDRPYVSDRKLEQESGRRGMEVRFAGNCMMDVFGFIPKSLDYQRRRKTIEQNIIDSLARFLASYLSDTVLKAQERTIHGELEKIVGEMSIFAKVNTEIVRNEVAFPFYDLDMSYNIIKRFRGKISSLQSKDLYEYLLWIYEILEELLKEEADAYGDVGFCYDEIFQKSAFIEAFRELKEDKAARGKIASFLNEFSGWTVSLYEPEMPRD